MLVRGTTQTTDVLSAGRDHQALGRHAISLDVAGGTPATAEDRAGFDCASLTRSPVVVGAGHEDAERVSCRVGVGAEGFVGVVGAVGQQPPPEAEDAVVRMLEALPARDGQIEVKLLWAWTLRPGCRR